MTWYYLNESGEVVGPVPEQALKEMNAAGSLTDASLVCREGTEEWSGLAEALGTRPSPSLGGESFKFNCPHCDQHIAAEPAQIELSVQCPACGGGMVVPTTDEAVAKQQGTPFSDASKVGGSQVEDTKNPDPEPEATEPSGSASSFADRLQIGAKAGWAGVKRHSNQASLIAQIEKLRNVDLRKAHYELGKKCFESGVLAEQLEEQFQAIRDLDAMISEKRKAEEVEEGETKMAALKRVGKHAAKASHAEALTLKRQNLLTHLGQSAFSIRENGSVSGLEAEIAAIEEVEGKIRSKEEEEARIPGAEAVHSFADRIKAGAREGWSDIERTSRGAAIHAQIEKLRNVDLRKTLFALGKKCYESGILQEELQEQFQEIRDLDATIASKREAGETVDAETKMDALKRMGKDATKSSHAQALTVKRQHLVTELGREASAKMPEEGLPGLEAEIAAIEEVEEDIRGKEEEARILGAGHAKGWKNRIPGIAVAAALILLLLGGSFFGLRMMGVGKDDDFVASKSEETQSGGVNSGIEKNNGPTSTEVEGLSVPSWFPPDDTTKATLNNFGNMPERARFSRNSSLPASRSLCEVYIRGYLFPNAYLAFADEGEPGLLRKAKGKQIITENMVRMTFIMNTGAFDRNENKDPRWHPDNDLPSLTRRQVYEKYYGFPISDELIEATEEKTLEAMSEGRKDQSFLTISDNESDDLISESEVQVFLESFDKFKNDYLKSKNPLPPGTYIWEPWMIKFHENITE